jgi:hypothetical protein
MELIQTSLHSANIRASLNVAGSFNAHAGR